MNPCPQMLRNEALVPLTEAEMLGNEALGAVFDEVHRNTFNNKKMLISEMLISEGFALPQGCNQEVPQPVRKFA